MFSKDPTEVLPDQERIEQDIDTDLDTLETFKKIFAHTREMVLREHMVTDEGYICLDNIEGALDEIDDAIGYAANMLTSKCAVEEAAIRNNEGREYTKDD